MNIAHTYENMDAVDSKSLAAMACDGDSALSVSAQQAQTYEDIESYLAISSLVQMQNGPGKTCRML